MHDYYYVFGKGKVSGTRSGFCEGRVFGRPRNSQSSEQFLAAFITLEMKAMWYSLNGRVIRSQRDKDDAIISTAWSRVTCSNHSTTVCLHRNHHTKYEIILLQCSQENVGQPRQKSFYLRRVSPFSASFFGTPPPQTKFDKKDWFLKTETRKQHSCNSIFMLSTTKNVWVNCVNGF